MKILHIFSGNSQSGAAKGALNLHKALKDEGINSVIYSEKKIIRFLNNCIFFINYKFKLLYLSIFGNEKRFLSLNSTVLNIPLFGLSKYDIIHIHWFNYSLDIEKIHKLAKKHNIVVTMRDMWLLTGGCHYTLDCSQFQDNCRRCPLYLKSSKGEEFRNEKHKLLSNINIITISKWLEKTTSYSGARYKTKFIYNTVDHTSFSDFDDDVISILKKKYQIFTEKKIILIGAINLLSDYKGKQYICRFIEHHPDCFFIFFGEGASFFTEKIKHSGYKCFGYIDAKQLNDLYNISDFFLMLSIQEAFGKTVIESLLTRTPVITLRGSSPEELIKLYDHPGSISWDGYSKLVLPNYERTMVPAEKYRERFCPKRAAIDHLEFYKDIAGDY
jgi:glycosyltransferase involved in cell wall biosynthesis